MFISSPVRMQMGASYSNDKRCLSVCLSHANISETERDRPMVTIKGEWEIGVSDSVYAIKSCDGQLSFRPVGDVR